MFIASFLQVREKFKEVTFSDFYCLINAKFWNTNKKILIKKSLLGMFIASFLQL